MLLLIFLQRFYVTVLEDLLQTEIRSHNRSGQVKPDCRVKAREQREMPACFSSPPKDEMKD